MGAVGVSSAGCTTAQSRDPEQRQDPAPLQDGATPRLAAAAADFDTWAEAFAADWVRQSPEFASGTQYFAGTGEQAQLDAQLGPLTPQRRQQRRALAQRGLQRLAAFDAAGTLGTEQRLSAALLQWSLSTTVAGEPFEDHRFVFDQLGGPHLRYVALLTENQALRTPADVPRWLARLGQVGPRIDEGIARAREASERGFLPPRFILERARGQVMDFLRPAVVQNVFVEAFMRRSERIEGWPTPAARQAAIDEAVRITAGSVRPAYLRVLALMDELLPKTTPDAGLWRLPQGAQAYAQALAANTTTRLGAEEIHTIGLAEVARIEAEMDRVLRDLGRKDGSVLVRMTALRAELQPPAEPDPRPGLIEAYTRHVRDAERRAQALFTLKPKAPVEVRRVPALTERTSSAYYTAPTPDGTRPGIFWAPLPGPSYDVLRMKSLAVHEAVPGHHFQIALQQEQQSLPRWRQRRLFGGGSAFSEGWALYAERLAIEHNWYEGDPHALLGAWDGQLFRARRLVVDTGLHAKRWTREQAIAYGLPAHEVERYVANPGQACAYYIGMLKILDLRAQARRELGARFELPAFHSVVLQAGSVPLDVLAGLVGRWTAAQKTAQAPEPTPATAAARPT